MKIYKLCVWAVFALFAVFSAGSLEVTDSSGRTVTFDTAPSRIVVAGRASLMVTDAVFMFPEASERVIAFENISQGKDGFLEIVDPHYSRKRKLRAAAGPEEVMAAKPDVVLMKSFMRSTLSEPLESLGMKVLYYDFETPATYFEDLYSLGTLFENQERAEEIITYYKERISKVEAVSEAVTQQEKPTALLLYYNERGGAVSFNVPPSSWMQTILVEKAGGVPVWKGEITGSGWTKVGIEQIAAWDPDYIFITSYFSSSEKAVEAVRKDPLWNSIGAVRDGQLYAFPSDFYSWDQPDPRWLLGLLWIGKMLHPDRLHNIDIMEEVECFYSVLYSLSRELYQSAVLPVLEGDLNRK
jgi:iron complex transport system substrate-binding protein